MTKKTNSLSKAAIARFNTFLNSHKAAVAAGKPLSEIMFCALTGLTYLSKDTLATMSCYDQHKYYRRKAMKHVLVNRVLAVRGLQLKSHNYCTSFTFTANVDYAIDRNETRAINAGIRNGNLYTGRTVHRGVWSKLTTTEANHLSYGYK